jgi:hypothetical protein
MKSIVVQQFGAEDELRLVESPTPGAMDRDHKTIQHCQPRHAQNVRGFVVHDHGGDCDSILRGN